MPDPTPIDLAATIRGRHVLVTGGSRGIGRRCVELLLAHGANVGLTYNRHQSEAEAIVAGAGGRASCHFLDLRDDQAIARCLAEFRARWPSLDILVANAAAGTSTVQEYEPDPGRIDEALFDINALGPFRVCRAALPHMVEGQTALPRKIIILSSVGGLQVFPSMRLADNMSKAAVVYMARQLAAELAQQPVDVFGVCPGATDTDMFRKSTLDKLDPAARARFVARLPKGRLIRPEEVATVILFLASGHSTVLHGAVLDMSMGLGVHPGLLTGQIS